MTAAPRHLSIDAARRRGSLPVEQLWLRHIALTGNADLLEVDAYLQGLIGLEPHDEASLAHVVDERLAELDRFARPPPAADDAMTVLSELIAAAAPAPAPPASAARERTLDFSALFDATPSPCLVLGSDLVVLAVNRAWERLTGTRRSDVIGRPVQAAFPDGTGGIAAADLQASLEDVTATTSQVMIVQHGADLDTRELSGWMPIAFPVLDKRGPVRMLLHRIDVSDGSTAP